jgi:hypothetical protein
MQTVYYIKLPDGSLKGPFPSAESASTVNITEGLSGNVISGTPKGQEILLG